MGVYLAERSLVQAGIPVNKAIIVGNGMFDKLSIRKLSATSMAGVQS